MNAEEILAALPKSPAAPPSVAVDGARVSLTYAAESHAARVSLDHAALAAKYDVQSAEQVDLDRRGGDGRLIVTEGFRVDLVLAPKPAPSRPKANG